MKLLLAFFLLTIANMGYGQFDQEEQRDTSIEETVEKTIDKVEEFTQRLEIEEFFEEDLPEFIEGLTPSKQEIENFEGRIQNGIECMRDFDASIIDRLVEDIVTEAGEIKEDIEEEIKYYKKSKRQTSKL